jgi:FkbM family methyltransferase
MLMSVKELARVWALRPQGVLHVGAHEGEEALDYESHGWLPVIWIEAQPNLVKNLQERLDPEFHKVIKAAVWDKDGLEMKFNLASNSQSSSLLSFGTHEQDYPEVTYTNQFQVVTQRLDSILKLYQVPNFLNLDIQGAEGMAIKSLGKGLENVEAIYTEINRKEVYLGCIMVEELDVLLRAQGFKRVATRWVLGRGWGDALYLRSSAHKINTTQKVQNILLNSKHVAVQFKGIIKRTIKGAIVRLFSIIKHKSQANGDKL